MVTPVELQAANAILKRGIRYPIPAPLFFRLLGKKEVGLTITHLHYGTDLRVCAILAENGITDKLIEQTDPAQLMLTHYKNILEIVALTTLNRLAVSRFALWMRRRTLRRLTVWQLLELYVSCRQYSGTTAFMNITRSALETRTTKPNLGQKMGS